MRSGRLQRAGVLALLVTSALLCAGLALTPSALAVGTIYWGNAKAHIAFANLDGSGGGELNITGGANLEEPEGTVLDPANGRIYWSNHDGEAISFANLNGSGGGNLNTAGSAANGPEGLAIDIPAGLLFWGNGRDNSISFAHLDGSGGGTLSITGETVGNPRGVAVDPATGMIYFSNEGGKKISFAHLDGSGGGELKTTGATVNGVEGLAVDAANGRLYWANTDAGISYAALNDSGGGGNLATPGITPNGPDAIAIEPVGERVYWTDDTDSKVEFAALNGSGGGQLATGGVTVNSPAFPVLLTAPVAAGVPVLSGPTVTGSTLTCTAGAWAPDLEEAFDFDTPQSFTYAWSENGAPVAGATSSTLFASTPGSYACQVTASNQAGSATQSSAPVTITVPPLLPIIPPPPHAKPTITHLSESAKTWRAGSRRAQISAKKPPLGTTFSFSLSVAASVSFTFTQTASGRRVGKRCVAQTDRNRHRAKCARTITAGALRFSAHAGTDKVRFDGVISSRRKLKPGSYTLLVNATSAGGHSATSSLRFTIAPA